MSFIQLENITKKFGSFEALKSISLEIKEGDLLAFIGHNGSGKTTLLRILASLDIPTSGKYIYRGDEIDELYKLNRRVTLVFQKSTMFNSSVKDNIAYGLKVRNFSKSKIDNKVSEALKLVKMQDHVNKNAKNLSGGEQQRVALARAFVIDPDLLLLDEPTANVDPGNAKIVEEAIKEIVEEKNTTVAIATHTLFQAKRLSNRTVHLYQGKIVEEGGTKELFKNPRDEKTKKFVSGELIF